jgi:hypothetical protein
MIKQLRPNISINNLSRTCHPSATLLACALTRTQDMSHRTQPIFVVCVDADPFSFRTRNQESEEALIKDIKTEKKIEEES